MHISFRKMMQLGGCANCEFDNYGSDVVLIEKCNQCGWSGRDAKTETSLCPKCGNLVSENRELKFGGMTITCYNPKRRFIVKNPDGQEVSLYVADIPDILAFLIRNAKGKA